MKMERSKYYKKILDGPVVELNENYGGLGALYINTTYENVDKIHQIDAVTGVTETNGSVRSRAIQVASELRQSGITEFDIIVICSRCHADQTIVVLATLLLGAVVAPLDPELDHNECVNLIGQLKPKVCFCDLRALKQIERVTLELGLNAQTKLIHFGDAQNEAQAFKKLLARQPGNFQPVLVDNPQRHVAFILPTQGTTGSPKLVCVSHHAIYAQTQMLLSVLENPVKIISFYPLSWMVQAVLMCLCMQTHIVRVLTGSFTERGTCKLIHDLKIDSAFLGTNLALKLVDHVALRDFNLSCLKCMIVGALPTSTQDIKNLITRLKGVKISQIYCATESGCITACLPDMYQESLEKHGTIGRVVQNCKARVVDIDSRKELGPEKYGELLVTGSALMLGYLRDLNLTKKSMEGEYFKTGDLAKYDSDGWLHIEGRIEDLLLINESRVSPRELEDVIMTHPFVTDVVIIGDEKALMACVIIKPETTLNEDKLMTFIAQRLPDKRSPNKIIFMDAFPKTSVGKVKKDVLREEFLKIKILHSESIAVVDNINLLS